MNNGGSAFPSVGEGFGNPLYSAPGMTLRDYFAAQAMLGMITMDSELECTDEAIARDAYKMADAMLAAREGGEDE